MHRILVVEDDLELATLLVQALRESGYECDCVQDGEAGLSQANQFDLLVVDVMMPVVTGFEMVQQLRTSGMKTPVIFLTARDHPKDIIQGLDVGGDDYLVKPFRLDELLARIRSLLRRTKDSTTHLRWHDIDMDCTKRYVTRKGREILLSSTEFGVLEIFMRHPEETLAKTQILAEVWRDTGYRDENLVELYVNYVRKKTETYGMSRVIHTVRGKGYVLALDPCQP